MQLKRRGRNLTGLCPFHSEKTPSFTVYPDNGSWYCFGCGAGGDAIAFVRRAENLDYPEAVRFLAQRAGLAVPEDREGDHTARRKARLYEMNREAARFFHDCLLSDAGKAALGYLRERGLTAKTIRHFGLGFAPQSWDTLRNHLRGKGFSVEEMLEGALVAKGRNDSVYDLFRGRVMFPIIDLRGNVVGFGGRILEGSGPKYLNSSDTPVFKKSRHLFAMNFAKAGKTDTLILGEGYMDVIAMHQAGFTNAVATLGTSLTAEQSRLIAQYAEKAVIAYDSDEAGQKAAKRAIGLLGETDVQVAVLELSGAKDPDEYIKKNGAQRFAHLVENSRGALQYEIDRLRAKNDTDDPEGKIRFLGEFCRLMAEVPNAIQREVFIGQVAAELDVGRERIASTVETIRKKKVSATIRRERHNLAVSVQDKSGIRKKPRENPTLGGYRAEESLIGFLFAHPDAGPRVMEQLSPEDFFDGDHRRIYSVVVQRLARQQPVEPIYLSGELDEGQIARVSEILAGSRELRFYREQADELTQAVKAQRDIKSSREVGEMSPEEYDRYITSLSANRK